MCCTPQERKNGQEFSVPALQVERAINGGQLMLLCRQVYRMPNPKGSPLVSRAGWHISSILEESIAATCTAAILERVPL